ncbi:WD40 repeat-like protein [Xylariomycetidae sp. FL0641]|nr:WD40 repeat-like protein [Xylariomycetidae sp. FL0641]
MDIHRCRFVPYPPSAINAVAFSHPVTSAKRSSPVRLAIGRANGDIEIWNPLNGLWQQETILHGGKDRSIDGLVWVVEPDQVLQDGTKLVGKSRLFSIGYTSTVTEWDLEKGRPKKQASGMHGDIWCLGAQPIIVPAKGGDKSKAKVYQTGKKLVAGTMDGCLVLYSIDDDDLRFDRILARTSKKTKMVSLAFQNRNTAVVGCSDSSIRVFDMRNGSILRKMTLGSDLTGGAKDIIVWSVKCLDGGDIVSGDSTGQVCIWDGKTYTQAQRLQTHNQDVLSLATSADGSTIVSGGMDRRTVLYRKTSGATLRWGKVWHRRYHSHDVKAMASFEGHGISVIVSGGPDARPVVLPLQRAGMENHRSLSLLPQAPPLRSACKRRLIVSWWDREVHIWRLREPLQDLVNSADGKPSVSKNRKLMARIMIKGEANITSAAISEDGSLLVVSTTSDIKAFHLHLKQRDDARRDELKISKVEVPEKVAAQGATQLQISPDGNWLCLVQTASTACMLSVSKDADSTDKPEIRPKAIRLNRIRRQVQKHLAFSGLGHYDRTITHVTFSPDSKMLAVADLAGYIDTWVLQQSQDRLQNGTNEKQEGESDESSSDSEDEEATGAGLRWTRNPKGSLIPKLQAAPTVLSFSNHVPTVTSMDDEDDDYTLLAVTAKPQVLFIHPSLGSLTPWSRRNPASRFPVRFRDTRDLVKGALWSGDRVWLYGDSFLFMFDLSQDLSEPVETSGNALVKAGKKRKRGPDSGAGNKMENSAVPTKIQRHIRDAEPEDLAVDGPLFDPMTEDETSQPADDSESDDSDEEREGELALLRGTQGKASTDAPLSDRPAFWCTYKYRPILGIVPLSSEAEAHSRTLQNGAGNEPSRELLEVALVERPLWETDMPERYQAD